MEIAVAVALNKSSPVDSLRRDTHETAGLLAAYKPDRKCRRLIVGYGSTDKPGVDSLCIAAHVAG